jgi:hypothetical protein
MKNQLQQVALCKQQLQTDSTFDYLIQASHQLVPGKVPFQNPFRISLSIPDLKGKEKKKKKKEEEGRRGKKREEEGRRGKKREEEGRRGKRRRKKREEEGRRGKKREKKKEEEGRRRVSYYVCIV